MTNINNRIKLKIRLEKWERAVVMQVLEQEGLGVEVDLFGSGGMRLECYNYPFLHSHSVYLRGGHDKQDLKLSTIEFITNEERDNYFDKVVKLLTEYKKSLLQENNKVTEDSFIFEL